MKFFYDKADTVGKCKIYAVPDAHYYGDNNEVIKYTCPICDAMDYKGSFPKGTENCPCCNINLKWEDEDDEI